MLFSGRFNHHRRPNYDKFPQRGFLVGLSLFPTLLHLEYSDLQAALQIFQNLRVRNQTGTLYFGFTHLRERQNGSTTKMSQSRQESGQIYSSLNLISLFAGEIQPFNANGSPYCTTALHMAFQFKSRYSNLNTAKEYVRCEIAVCWYVNVQL